MIDRNTPPQVALIKDFTFVKAKTFDLNAPHKGFYIDATDQEIVKVELILKAGYREQKKPMQAAAVNKLLLEGTKHRSAMEIASLFEGKGAFLDTDIHADYASLVLHCLSRHLDELFPLVLEMLNDASFPEEEWLDFKQNKLNQFSIKQEKVSFLTKNAFAVNFFGKAHAYNNSLSKSDFDALSREDLLEFYEQHYVGNPITVLLSGKVKSRELDLIKQHLGGWKKPKAKNNNEGLNFNSTFQKGLELNIEKEGASQSAIRMGLPMPQKGSADFPKVFLANTLLGGFFGSRLMSNLREDKGYTYGIGSGIVNLEMAAYWFLTTEVGVEHTANSLKEIKVEMQKLNETEVEEEELQLVKSYLQGTLMRNFDGPFQAMDRFKSIHLLGLDYSYYENFVQQIKTIEAKELLAIYRQYFKFENTLKIIAGKK
ncbi:MAG: pitrilysin family protein [Vicingaceae bacterium]